MIENVLCFVQNLIDNINGFIEPLWYEIQRYALTYPDAFNLLVCVPIITIFAIAFVAILICLFVLK